MRWLRRWLLNKDEPTVESAVAIVPDARLLCTKTGQVLSDFHGKSVFDLNVEREAELAKQRAEFQATSIRCGRNSSRMPFPADRATERHRAGAVRVAR